MSDFPRNVNPIRLPFKVTPRLVIIVLVVIVIVAAAFTSFFVVDQTEEAVVTTFGKFNRVVEPGLNLKLPFGIEQNYNVPTQVTQNMNFGFRTDSGDPNQAAQDFPDESQMLTGDLNIIDVQWIIQFNILDIKNWLFKVQERTKTIRDISQSVVNELVGDRTIFDVLGPARTAVENETVIEMNRLFDQYELGVRVTAVKLQNVVPPSGKVHEAFDDVNKAQQDMNRLINEGKQQFNTAIPNARGKALQTVQQASGYAAERVNNAEGDVARFNAVLKQYQVDPNDTKVRLYNEMVEAVFSPENQAAGSEQPNLIDKQLKNIVPLLNFNGAAKTPLAPATGTGGAQ